MIKIESVTIENFRGIKRLPLEFGQANFGIYGPNGTGKSGIVDAIEFGLTGNITRLTGRGAGELSVKDHAPHVDNRDEPGQSVVTLHVYSPTLKKKFVIERRVSKPKQPRVNPNDEDIQALVKRLSKHPELALSRREIVKYVIAEPGARSEEVQALLKLDDMGKLRRSFTTVTNNFKRDARSAEDLLASERAKLLSGLEISAALVAQILESVNKRRSLLGAAPLLTYTKDINIKEGITPGAKKDRIPVSKAAASSDVANLSQLANSQNSHDMQKAVKKVAEISARLQTNPSLLRDLKHHSLLQKGLELLEGNECPLCGADWKIEELRLIIQQRLTQARLASELKVELQQAAQPIRVQIRSLSGLIDLCLTYGEALLKGRKLEALTTWKDSLLALENGLETNPLSESIQSWLNDGWAPPVAANDELLLLAREIAALPDISERDAAWDFLVIGQERLENYGKAKAVAVETKRQFETAARVTATYAETCDSLLVQLYEKVQDDFSRYYAIIHHEDESSFFAQLIPSIGKLSFAVDFYGRGTFPPGAYHSEGHQDSMGLCLYLALMKWTMATDFTIAILDDVLMSVDAGHRKDVVRLLKAEFPDTQFIFTTHDQVWLKHMMTEGLIGRKSSLQIKKWSVDEGPSVETARDVWSAIADELATNNMINASALLRNHLEETMQSLAEGLRASVEYRKEIGHDFGELVSPVVGRWKSLLGQAKGAANSWNNREQVRILGEMEDRFTSLHRRTGIDNWMINKVLHYNEWANLQPQEFSPLVNAYREFLNSFECTTCRTILYVTPSRGKAEALRCTCSSFNLLPKSSTHNIKTKPPEAKKPAVNEQQDLF